MRDPEIQDIKMPPPEISPVLPPVPLVSGRLRDLVRKSSCAGEPGDDLCDNGLKIFVRTIDCPVGILLVQRDPLVIHLAEALARDKDDAPCRDVPESFFHLLKGDLQVHDNAPVFQVFHCSHAEDNTASRCNNSIGKMP